MRYRFNAATAAKQSAPPPAKKQKKSSGGRAAAAAANATGTATATAAVAEKPTGPDGSTTSPPAVPAKKAVSRPPPPPPIKLKETDIVFQHTPVDLQQQQQFAAAADGEGGAARHYKVIIVGAGAAGLGAARQLIDEHGLAAADILVLEGGDRLGGRIHTKFFEARAGLPAVRVDLGASYLHGYDFEEWFDEHKTAVKNPLQRLAEQHQLALSVDPAIEQAYSAGWRQHAAWFVKGTGQPAAAKWPSAKTGQAVGAAADGGASGGGGSEAEWNGPDSVFAVELEIDARLEAIAERLSEERPPDGMSHYGHADMDGE
jgi:hypothetical protein